MDINNKQKHKCRNCARNFNDNEQDDDNYNIFSL